MKKLFALTALASVMSSAAMVKPLDEPWLKPGEKLVCFGDSITAGKGYYIKHLRAALEKLCLEKKIKFVVPPRSLCGDNGAMIAVSGCFEYLAGNFADTSLNASASDDL